MEKTSVEQVDAEIHDIKNKIKLLEAGEKDAADKLDDTRWQAVGKALRVAREAHQRLETKRAEIMAGIHVEPVTTAAAPQQPQNSEGFAQRYLSDTAVSEYYAAETAALKSMGLDEKARNMPFTYGAFAAFYKHLESALHDMRDRIEAVEASGIKAGGTYQRALAYDRGTVVSHQGSAWVAIKEAEAGVAPTDDHAVWQLLVKKGRDGKDASS